MSWKYFQLHQVNCFLFQEELSLWESSEGSSSWPPSLQPSSFLSEGQLSSPTILSLSLSLCVTYPDLYIISVVFSRIFPNSPTLLVYLYLFIQDFVKKEKPMLYPSNLLKVKGMNNSTAKTSIHESYPVKALSYHNFPRSPPPQPPPAFNTRD